MGHMRVLSWAALANSRRLPFRLHGTLMARGPTSQARSMQPRTSLHAEERLSLQLLHSARHALHVGQPPDAGPQLAGQELKSTHQFRLQAGRVVCRATERRSGRGVEGRRRGARAAADAQRAQGSSGRRARAAAARLRRPPVCLAVFQHLAPPLQVSRHVGGCPAEELEDGLRGRWREGGGEESVAGRPAARRCGAAQRPAEQRSRWGTGRSPARVGCPAPLLWACRGQPTLQLPRSAPAGQADCLRAEGAVRTRGEEG